MQHTIKPQKKRLLRTIKRHIRRLQGSKINTIQLIKYSTEKSIIKKKKHNSSIKELFNVDYSIYLLIFKYWY